MPGSNLAPKKLGPTLTSTHDCDVIHLDFGNCLAASALSLLENRAKLFRTEGSQRFISQDSVPPGKTRLWVGVFASKAPMKRGEKMIRVPSSTFSVGLVVTLFLLALSASAQVTTGNVTGRVVDSSGGVI